MLADDRAGAFVSRFLFPWLQLDTLARSPTPTSATSRTTCRRCATPWPRETELFLLSQLRDDRDLVELWSAGYTFLNEQLARHYGVAGVSGPQFRRVPLAAPERAGLLGQGSVLMVTSRHQHGVDAAYTTPAKRSIWVRQHFLGAPLPNGFPGAQPVKPELPITPQTRALAAEPCGNCHRNFFPIGYALENFDPLGRWRTHDQAGPVDAPARSSTARRPTASSSSARRCCSAPTRSGRPWSRAWSPTSRPGRCLWPPRRIRRRAT